MIGENGLENLIWFMGYVEDNSDTLNGRVRVRAFGFHPPVTDNTVRTEDLPWAHVVRDSKFSSIPDNGDFVVGFFLDGRDAQHPIVIGTINSAKFSAPSSVPGYNPESYNPDGTPGASGEGAGGTERSQYAYEYFISKGFTPQQAAGIVGNLQAESGPNLDSLYNPAGGGTGARGIAQWRGPRTQAFIDRYGTTPDLAPLDDQLDFIMYEFETTESKSYNTIKGATTASEAASIFDSLYERSGGGTIQTRVNNAETLLQSFGANTNSAAIEGRNEYLATSQDSVNNYANPALPPAFHGENIEYTAALVQSATRRENEPGIPMPSGSSTSVWHNRYGGSSIELSGKNGTDESIHINHSSGSRVTLDGNGNITIKSIGGKLHISSENEIDEIATDAKNATYGSYELTVTDGTCNIRSTGDMLLSSGGNMTFEAAGNMKINTGVALDVAASTIHLTAREDSVDIVAANKLALQSTGGTASIIGKGGTYIQSDAGVNIKGSGMIRLGGSAIHLNSPGEPPADAITAIQAAVPAAIEKSIVSDIPKIPSTPPIDMSLVDDVTIGSSL